ncbi:hypothetical protein CITRIK5_30647 [Citricoccus sp. K5]|nr:hypothetical protein CITRIK5_30647 [Citricoccus sp. K5]
MNVKARRDEREIFRADADPD